VTFDDYLKVIEYKTATAFETASRLGAIISGGSEEEIESLAIMAKILELPTRLEMIYLTGKMKTSCLIF